MGERVQEQKTVIISIDKPFHIDSDRYIKLERFTIIDDNPEYEGQRICIIVHGKTPRKDGQMMITNVPISSFIIGTDYEQEANLLLSPLDNVDIKMIGPDLKMQILYSEINYLT